MNSTTKQITKKAAAGLTAAYALSLVHTTNIFAGAAAEINRGAGTTGQSGPSFQDSIQVVTNLLLFLVGIIAVIAIIIGGIRYTTSNGDASQVKAAKDTILYAVIGLLVAIMAYAIVRWVVNLF